VPPESLGWTVWHGCVESCPAALIEILQVVGERGINIAPRVMVNGAGTGETSGETTALIGTMLDSMIDKNPPQRNPSNDNN